MPTTQTDFWRKLGSECGPLSKQEHAFIELSAYRSDYERADHGAEERAETVDLAAEQIGRWRKAGVWSGEMRVQRPGESAGEPDDRWDLLRDLEHARGREMAPPLIAEGRAVHISTTGGGVAERVTISFDSRLSKPALFRGLGRLWPHLQAAGWVRRSGHLGDRKLALVRFVCLEGTAGESWRSRFGRWNECYSQWQYAHVRAFQSDFRRAETSLTGRRYGLDWFCDSEMQWLYSYGGTVWQIREAAEGNPRLMRAFTRAIKRVLPPMDGEMRRLDDLAAFGDLVALGRFRTWGDAYRAYMKEHPEDGTYQSQPDQDGGLFQQEVEKAYRIARHQALDFEPSEEGGPAKVTRGGSGDGR